MTLFVISSFIFLSALLTIWGASTGRNPVVYVFKPLTMVLVIGLAISLPLPLSNPYKKLVLIAFLFSLCGDIFLMLPKDRFIPGLVSFLIAHVIFITAFGGVAGFFSPLWPMIPLLLFAGFMMRSLWPTLGGLKGPVVVYMIALLLMVFEASHVMVASPGHFGGVVLLGALFFMASDSFLAWNRFKRPLRRAPLLILSTYFVAQYLIAMSLS